MKRKTILAVMLLAGMLYLAVGNADDRGGQAAGDKVVFAKSGYSIAVLDEPGEGGHQSLFMFMPASEDFAPNVNVSVQKYEGTLADYVALSKKQFEEMGVKLLAEPKVVGDSAIFEYAGQMEGNKMRWYSKAAAGRGRVYLATATATENQWKAVGGKLRACVDSLTPLTVPATQPAS